VKRWKMRHLLMASAIGLVTAGCTPDAVQRNFTFQRDSDTSSFQIRALRDRAPSPDRDIVGADAAAGGEDEASQETPESQDTDESDTTPATDDGEETDSVDETTNDEPIEDVTEGIATPIGDGDPVRRNPSCENSRGNANSCG
jgi:hypothetical protein